MDCDMTSKIKAIQRDNAVKNEGIIYKHPAFITTRHLFDVKQALYDTHIITHKSIPLLINKDKQEAKKIDKKSRQMFKKTIIAAQSLHEIKLNKILDEGDQIDYFFCDLCGNYTVKNAYWFYKHRHFFADGCRLPLTVQVLHRKTEWHKAILEITKASKNYILPDVREMISQAKDIGFFGLSYELILNLSTQLNALFVSLPDKKIVLRSITVYKNSDINTMAKEMAYLDIVLYDKKFDNKTYGKFMNCIKEYQRHTKGTILKKKKRGRKKKVKPVLTYAQRLNISTKRDLRKLELRGVKAAITRLAKQNNTKVSSVIGGIRREVTMRYRKTG